MLTLFRTPDCAACDEVEGKLRELRLAHRTVDLSDAAAEGVDLPPDSGPPPLLGDDGQTYAGSQAIASHLEYVAAVKDRWQQHGSDACYCDE